MQSRAAASSPDEIASANTAMLDLDLLKIGLKA